MSLVGRGDSLKKPVRLKQSQQDQGAEEEVWPVDSELAADYHILGTGTFIYKKWLRAGCGGSCSWVCL